MASAASIEEIVSKSIEKLLIASEQNSQEIPELSQRSSRVCNIKFTLNLMKNLQIDTEIVLAGLIMIKRSVNLGLKFSKKSLNKLIAVSILIAEKCYSQQQNSLESYSLITAIPIKELASMEIKLLVFLNYKLFIEDREFNLLLRGDIDSIFGQ